MKITQQTKQYMVIDDFLSSSGWDEVWKYLQTEHYHQANALNWAGAWRLDDGPVMRGPAITYRLKDHNFLYPTGKGIDCLIKGILDHQNDFAPAIGKLDQDWAGFTALAMLYPRESGLYWHRDAHTWTGSYTYYAHREWNAQWGGELLIADETTNAISADYGIFFSKPKPVMGLEGEYSFGSHLDNKDANSLLMENGFGTYIMPKPNRLVLISGGSPHYVKKVDPAAGDRVRASVSGFFQKVGKGT